MVETATINTLNIEDFMSSFGITRLETQKDEGLLSKGSCKQRILDLITLNIKNFRLTERIKCYCYFKDFLSPSSPRTLTRGLVMIMAHCSCRLSSKNLKQVQIDGTYKAT